MTTRGFSQSLKSLQLIFYFDTRTVQDTLLVHYTILRTEGKYTLSTSTSMSHYTVQVRH